VFCSFLGDLPHVTISSEAADRLSESVLDMSSRSSGSSELTSVVSISWSCSLVGGFLPD
jgi:hypothetical protein